MIELIPAIDIIDGKCVRLTQGDYATKKVYNEDPLEVAKMFEGNGIRRLHVVDLDGAREGRIINYRILERIATRTSLIIDFFYQRILRQGDYQGDLHGYRTGWYAARPGYRFI